MRKDGILLVMKKYFSLICALVTLSLVACSRTPVANPDPNHTHADFAIWVDGQKIDFSGPEYMSGTSDEHDPDHEKHDKYLHLHDGNGHVIHRHKPGLTFGDFLATIGVHVEAYYEQYRKECVTVPHMAEVCDALQANDPKHWSFYVNGVLRNVLEDDPPQNITNLGYAKGYVFHDGDQILLRFGIDDPEQIRREIESVGSDACKYSKTCPWRGDPPTENCIADPTVPCTQ